MYSFMIAFLYLQKGLHRLRKGDVQILQQQTLFLTYAISKITPSDVKKLKPFLIILYTSKTHLSDIKTQWLINLQEIKQSTSNYHISLICTQKTAKELE